MAVGQKRVLKKLIARRKAGPKPLVCRGFLLYAKVSNICPDSRFHEPSSICPTAAVNDVASAQHENGQDLGHASLTKRQEAWLFAAGQGIKSIGSART